MSKNGKKTRPGEDEPFGKRLDYEVKSFGRFLGGAIELTIAFIVIALLILWLA